MKKQDSEKAYIAVRNWFLSFIPLGIAAVLFVLCFLFERMIWLYAIFAVVFALFVLLYIRADRAIVHPDGYSYIQAMAFYKACTCAKSGVDLLESVPMEHLLLCAKEFDYAMNLSPKQVVRLYKTGKDLFERIKKGK